MPQMLFVVCLCTMSYLDVNIPHSVRVHCVLFDCSVTCPYRLVKGTLRSSQYSGHPNYHLAKVFDSQEFLNHFPRFDIH
jgi:hypothetical protein